MRGDTVYRIYGIHEGREKDVYFGAFRTPAEAEAKIVELHAREMHGRNWAKHHHDKGFVLREAVVETDFVIPSLPKPRDKYVVRTTPKPNRPGTWDSTTVEVLRRAGLEKVCEYERSYSMLQTFEPFRQGDREFALISRDYTRTAVLDLGSGEVIAEEGENAGFCPVGFYVPDWWDVNDGSIIPGSEYWDEDSEWPTGDFGFVWGCYWGDDTSWKVQYLDLSGIQEGIIRREERFGYVELATSGYRSPCLTLEPKGEGRSAPPQFISTWRHDGEIEVTFEVEMKFDLKSGKPKEWERTSTEA